MHRGSTFDRPDAEFIARANTVNDQCTAHATAWHLDAERLAALNALTAKAGAAYAANSDRATRNQITSANKKKAFSDLKHFLSLFVDYLTVNLSVPDEALAVMGLRPRRRPAREPLPRPLEAPVLTAVIRHGQMTLHVARPELGHPQQSTTRKGYFGFKLRWRFEDETRWRHEISTRLSCTLRFEPGEQTKRIVLEAAWINPRLEEGPWSGQITEIVG
ncbi:MAG: hypothetical protein LBL07_07255 [Tannerella sp.]|jgi:hypothetical protein|nr:hypothetical protein [Tannerella sp.]